MSAEGAEATGGEGVVDELLAVVLAASPGTPTLTCRTIAEAVASRVQQAEAERDDWKDSAQRRWDRARAAEAERDALRERVEALADEAESWQASATVVHGVRGAAVVRADRLRAALDG